MNMELVSDDGYHPSEASLKVSSRSNIRNLVKTVRIIHNYVLDTHTHTHTLTDIELYDIDKKSKQLHNACNLQNLTQ